MSDVCCVSGVYTVDAAITVQPVNTVALAGTSVRLQCTTGRGGSPGEVGWTRNPGTDNDVIVKLNCQRDSSFPEYSVVSTSAGQCDLVINNVSLELAATYWCFDTGGSVAVAELTVIGELYVLFTEHDFTICH